MKNSIIKELTEPSKPGRETVQFCSSEAAEVISGEVEVGEVGRVAQRVRRRRTEVVVRQVERRQRRRARKEV